VPLIVTLAGVPGVPVAVEPTVIFAGGPAGPCEPPAWSAEISDFTIEKLFRTDAVVGEPETGTVGSTFEVMM
jgi:hypothetical protein